MPYPTFSQNDKQLQGTPGAIAVLHTHSRKLDYHPHLHVIMPLPTRYPKAWVVDCTAVGEGSKAIIYLGRYLYRGVIREKDILKIDKGKVTFQYKDSQTKKMKKRTVSGALFLKLLMQHVLPKGFRRSRNYGFLHPNSTLLKQIQLITHVFIGPTKPTPRGKVRCTCCGGLMKIVQTRIKSHRQTWWGKTALKTQAITP